MRGDQYGAGEYLINVFSNFQASKRGEIFAPFFFVLQGPLIRVSRSIKLVESLNPGWLYSVAPVRGGVVGFVFGQCFRNRKMVEGLGDVTRKERHFVSCV